MSLGGIGFRVIMTAMSLLIGCLIYTMSCESPMSEDTPWVNTLTKLAGLGFIIGGTLLSWFYNW